MFLYIAILIAILLGLVYEQNACPAYSPRTRGFGAFLLVFLIGLIVGVRDMLGGYDVYCYAIGFENAPKEELSLEMFFSLGGKDKSDVGWTLWNKILRFFTDDKYVLFFITAIVSYLFLFRHLRKFAPYFFFALLIIFCRQFLQSFIYVRQFLACVTIWFSLDFAIKRRLIPFLLIVFVAANIHLGSLVFALVYPLGRWKIPTFVMIGGFSAALFLGMTPAFGSLLESFGSSFENEKAMGYVESTGGGVHPFYMIEGILIAFALLISRQSVYGITRTFSGGGSFLKLKKIIPGVNIEPSEKMVLLFNVTFLYVCASFSTLQSPGMMRLIWVFWIGPICMLPYICEKMDAGKSASAFKFVIIVYFISAFWLFCFRFGLMEYRTFIF